MTSALLMLDPPQPSGQNQHAKYAKHASRSSSLNGDSERGPASSTSKTKQESTVVNFTDVGLNNPESRLAVELELGCKGAQESRFD